MSQTTSYRKIGLAGYSITDLSADALVDFLDASIACGQQRALFFANSHFVVQCLPIRHQMHADHITVVNDGVAMDLASRCFNGRQFLENLNGTDFVPYYLRKSALPLRVFLLGGRRETAEAAGEIVRREFSHQVVGVCDGFEGRCDVAALVDQINASKADVVLVGMGNPTQEIWILQHGHLLCAKVLIGVGALFSYMTSESVRAPQLVRQARLEWAWRLLHEPRRLVKRYTLGGLTFVRLCIAERTAFPIDESVAPRDNGTIR